MAALPAGNPFREFLQAAEGSVRLGQGVLALARATDGAGLRFGQRGQQATKVAQPSDRPICAHYASTRNTRFVSPTLSLITHAAYRTRLPT
jgi:hypothetical protein